VVSSISSQRGAATVHLVLFTVVILGFLTLAVDVGRMYLIQGELQNAADAPPSQPLFGLTAPPTP
jgi:uncharacterized membrane protein